MSDLEQLVRASRLYYELGETQGAIAEQLGVTRPQVSRLLKRARAEGIVEIRIIDSTRAESPAGDALRRSYGLDAVALAPTIAGPEDLTRRMVGRLAAQVLRAAVRDGNVIGIGDGASVSAMADALDEVAGEVAATVVPLCGGYWSTGPEREPFRRIAEALGAQPHGLMAPGLVDDAATKRALVAHAGVRTVLDLWERLDVAVVGIGGPAWSSAAVGRKVARELDHGDAVGEVLVAPFDLDGSFVCPALRRAGHRLRCASAGSGPGGDRRRLGREQGATDPRCPACRAPAHAGHRCRHRGGRRRARCGHVVTRPRATSMSSPTGRSTTPVVLGIDLGTNEVKAGVVALDGRLVALGRAGYPMDVSGGPGWAEQDPGAWWSAVVSGGPCHPPGRARRRSWPIGVDGHGPTLVAVDEGGEATRPAITWLDTRTAAEADELAAATGVRGWALGGLPAALWVERHEPTVARATRWYLSTWEWLAFRLSRVAVASLVADQLVPGRPLVATTGIPSDKLPPVGRTGEPVGALTEVAAAALGLRAGIPVVGGTVDAFASYHGAGLLRPGDAYDPGGSAGGFGVYWDRPVEVAGGFVTPAPLPGRYSVGAAMAATGRALDWYRDSILGGAVTTETLIAEAARTPPGADGLVFLPYLAGERSPLWDPDARAVFAGLTLGHGRGHLARAILEASALAIRHVSAPMLAAGVRVTEMRTCGGPARSEVWNTIKADVTGFRVAVPAVLETAVLGSAILAAVGIGAHADLETAIAAMTSVDHRIEPDPSTAAVYDRLYDAYVALYPATAPILRGIA